MKKLTILSAILLLAGCSPTAGSNNKALSAAAASLGSGSSSDGSNLVSATPVPIAYATPDPNVICATLAGAFGEGGGCASPTVGLKGNIYILENGYSGGSQIQISYILNNGIQLSKQLQMTNFNVPTRDFTEGFPLSDGTLLKGPNGQAVTAWFAFNLNGYLTLQAPYASGQYQFGFFVDDGAILSLDGQQVVNFDGYHSPQWGCGSTPVQLNLSEQHSLNLQYFQGPPTQLALRMMFRPYNPSGSCDDNGGWLPVPSNFLTN